MLAAMLMLTACGVPGRRGPSLYDQFIEALVPVPSVPAESIPDKKDIFEMTPEDREAAASISESVNSPEELYDDIQVHTSVTTDVIYYRDQEYKATAADDPDANLFDICVPSNLPTDNDTAPFVLLVSGGSWRSIKKESMQNYLLTLAHYGYAAASINTRTLPDYNYADQLEDVLDSLQYFHNNADSFYIDASKMFVVGFSSGGNLSLMAAYTRGEGFVSNEKQISYTFDIKSVTSVAAPIITHQIGLEYMGLGSSSIGNVSAEMRREVEFFLGVELDESLAGLSRIDPSQFITKDAPPTLILQGMKDTTVGPENAEALYNALLENGVETYMVQYADGTHTNLPEQQVLKDIFTFFWDFITVTSPEPSASE